MAKYLKFAIAQSGTLVYRSNGNAYRGQYTTKKGANGVITVYNARGRKIGAVGKGTAKEQRIVESKDKRNRARRKAAIKQKDVQRGIEYLSGLGETYEVSSYQAWYNAKIELDQYPRDSWKKFEVSFSDQSKLNFATALKEGVDAGVMTLEEAAAKWDEYQSLPDHANWSKDRSDMWRELGDYYDEMGFVYIKGD